MRRLRRVPLHHQEIAFRLGGAERFFSPRLCVALAVATLLHLIGWFSFAIHENRSNVRPPKPRIVVATSELAPQKLMETEIALAKLLREAPKLGTATAKAPDLPLQPDREINRHLVHQKKPTDALRYFDHLESTVYEPDSVDFGFHQSRQPVTVHIAGPLAEIPLLQDGLLAVNALLKGSTPTDKQHISFRVKMSGNTGSIFWFDAEESSDREEVNLLAERLLRYLQFSSGSERFVAEGRVEMVISVDPTERLEALFADLDHLENHPR